MKKALFSLCLLLAIFTRSNAQFVTIPDTNFVNYLQNNFAGAMNGNQMDTTFSGLISVGSINVSNKGISNLFGIQFFDSLIVLNCNSNNLTSLPTLPRFLKQLYCDNNQLNILPSLPDSLEYLNCSINNLTSLPALPILLSAIVCNNNILTSLPTLPSNLGVLIVYNNNLTQLPILPNSINSINCANNNLTNLPLLPVGLNTLSCQNNSLTSLPPLPNYLVQLDCQQNQITSIPTLPNSLNYFNCSNNLISSLTLLPNFLVEMHCEYNQMSNLPALPNTLITLVCANNQLTSLPALPNKLEDLNCANNLLISLPTLSDSLLYLYSVNNLITTLPIIPSKVVFLHIENNQLTSLPILPNSLIELSCGNNLIPSISSLPINLLYLYCNNSGWSTLPNLPPSLFLLYAYNNNLNILPDFPSSLSAIDLRNNPNLSCLPKLATNLDLLNVDSTLIQCIPNYFNFNQISPSSTIGINSYPLCTPTSGCPFFYNIAGNIHQDTSANCQADSIAPGNNLQHLKVQMLKNNVVQEQFYSTPAGNYSFDANSGDTLDVQIDTTGLPFTVACPSNAVHHEVLTPADSVHTNVNFGIQQNGVDAFVHHIYGRFRPTFTSTVNILAGDAVKYYNFAGVAYGGTVTTTFSGPVQFVSAASGALVPSTVVGSTLTYTIADFTTLSASAFDIILKTDTAAPIGSAVCITTKITNVAGDINPTNDSLNMCFNVVNSLDPNEKTVYPQNAKAGDWLTYNIQFQNTGNDTAFLVVVKDTLSANLDASSFTLLGASHEAITQIKGNVVTFTFAKINLLDSLHNEPASHGWIQFKIKLKNGLPNLTKTTNQAAIYFDYNPPIFTNIATNQIAPLSINNYTATNAAIKVYPNPTNTYFTVQHNMQGSVSAKLFSVDGKMVYSTSLQNTKQVIDVSTLTEGVYTLEVSNNQGLRKVEKVVVRK